MTVARLVAPTGGRVTLVTVAEVLAPGSRGPVVGGIRASVAREIKRINADRARRAEKALHAAALNAISAAMIDIHLPDLNGLVLAHKLRQCLGSETPIVVVSGDTSMELLNSLAHVGATYFLSKPVSSTILLERLREFLNASNRRAG